ncbi:MAG: hypothetical protein LBI43_04760 [Streptococcaceae bacterium]|jgi:hypothetical protein|nr:hypothetical protein [Streptococcaceae bacterium]
MKRTIASILACLIICVTSLPVWAMADNPEKILSKEEMIRHFYGFLTEVLSFSENERDSTTISAELLDGTSVAEWLATVSYWKVTLSIKADDLRKATTESLKRRNAHYDETNELYSLSYYFELDGSGIGMSLNEYFFGYLIPTSEYPGDAVPGNEYRYFLEATPEEKAAFSAKWKPLLDQWLAERPDIVRWLEQDTGIYTAIAVTRHAYGVPSDKAIPLETAIQIAKDAYLNSGITGFSYLTGEITRVTEEMIEERCSINSFYDITDEEQPLWKIHISYAAIYEPLQEDHADGYHVIMNAITGQILNEYTSDGSGLYEWMPPNVFRWAEEFL